VKVAVVGLGRVGLPIATAIAGRGHDVVGCDIDPQRVAMVQRGENPFPEEAGLGELLGDVTANGHLRTTTDTTEGAASSDTVLCTVAVDLDAGGRADLHGISAAARAISAGLRPGALVIFDTTVPPSTTRQILAPLLEEGGKQLGSDFSVAFSPERLFMGRVLEDLPKYPKVVGGLDAESGTRAVDFFREALGSEVIELASAEAAELSKVAEGVYRDLNIALANELAQAADLFGADVSEVIAAANSQPFSHIHTPGAGVGGHCIPVYPRFLMQGEAPSTLAAAGRAANDAMPAYLVGRLDEIAGGLAGKRCLVLGLTFRPDVAVTAHTNAVDLLRELAGRGAKVWGHDALLSPEAIAALGFTPAAEPLARYDVAIVHALHAAYRSFAWGQIAPLVLDARNALDRGAVEATGARYVGAGRPLTA